MNLSEKPTMLIDGEIVPDPTECFAVPGQDSIIDCVHPVTGKTCIYGKTLEDVQQEEPKAVKMTVEQWAQEKAKRQDGELSWEPITEERYYEMLECLPPACYRDHGFLVGEPWDHHALTGAPRYQACIHTSDGYFASSRPMEKREFLGK